MPVLHHCTHSFYFFILSFIVEWNSVRKAPIRKKHSGSLCSVENGLLSNAHTKEKRKKTQKKNCAYRNTKKRSTKRTEDKDEKNREREEHCKKNDRMRYLSAITAEGISKIECGRFHWIELENARLCLVWLDFGVHGEKFRMPTN